MSGRGCRVVAFLALLATSAFIVASSTSARDVELDWILHERCLLQHAGPPGPQGDKLVVVSAGSAWIRREGRRIVVFEYTGPPCRGGQPTVDNLDRIVLKSVEPVLIDAGKGLFEPGATPERGGSEIEIRAYGKKLYYWGTAGLDRIVARTGPGRRLSFDLNSPAVGRGDVDLIHPGPNPGLLKISGGRGPDLIDARRAVGFNGIAHRLFLRGARGDDTIQGSPGAEWAIEGGPGDDLVHAGGGGDLVWVGRGHDVLYGDAGPDELRYEEDAPDPGDRIFGGRGNDSLDDRNGRRDLLRCGPGRDRVWRDRFDRPGPRCEVRFAPTSQPEDG